MTTERLQLALADLGFDPGPADGRPGPLTQMALERFQRAYRLHSDEGRVGPATLRLLRTELPRCRRVVYASDETSLSKLAAQVGATSEAFVEANGHRAHAWVYPGESLTVYRRAAMRTFEGVTLDVALDTAPVGAPEGASGHSWSRVLVPMGKVTCDGQLELAPCPDGLLACMRQQGSAVGVLEFAGPVRAKRAVLAKNMLIAAGGWAPMPLGGLVLRAAGLDLEGGVCFAQAAAALARAVSHRSLRMEVGAQVRLSDAVRAIDLEELSDAVDWIVVELPAPIGAGASWDRLREAAKLAPRWKLVAGIDLRPFHVTDDACAVLGWQEFAALRKRHVMREAVQKDTGLRQFTYRARGQVRRIFAEDRGSLARTLHHVNTLNMLGVAFIGVPPDSSWVDEEMRKKFIPM